jgi:signal transduction histidine kinase
MLRRLLQPWVRSASPWWVGALFAALSVILGALTALLEVRSLPGERRVLGFSLLGLMMIAWLIETSKLRCPRWVFIGATLAAVSALLFIGGPTRELDTIAPLLPALTVAWVTFVGTRHESVATLVLALIGIMPRFLFVDEDYDNWLVWSLAVLISWSSSYAIATQQRLLAQLRAAQAEIVRQSAAEERHRIAREVHDIIAHTLAVTLLHLTGARHILTRDPQRASEALAEAEKLGRRSMTDIRRIVGLLGGNGNADVTAPLPNACNIADLVAAFANAGLDIQYTVSGDPATLPPTIGLDLYRIAQEALANAAKHAPDTHVEAALQIEAREVLLRVCDSGRRNGVSTLAIAGAGLGLNGMRERARLLGGALTAHKDGTGWLVECRFPL